MVELKVNEIKFVAHSLAQKLMKFSEPIPDFSTRYPAILESCLNTPFQRYANKDVYKGFTLKAAMLFYLMIKNHPFQNGNKRVAIMTLLYFLSKNNKWLEVDTKELYNFSVWVAESPADLKDEVVAAIVKKFKKYIISLQIK